MTPKKEAGALELTPKITSITEIDANTKRLNFKIGGRWHHLDVPVEIAANLKKGDTIKLALTA